MLNSAQFTTALRLALQWGGGFLVARGYATADNVAAASDAASTIATVGPEIVGAVMTVGGFVWSMWARRNDGLLASAAKVPAVQAIVTDDATAERTPSPKIVAR